MKYLEEFQHIISSMHDICYLIVPLGVARSLFKGSDHDK